MTDGLQSQDHAAVRSVCEADGDGEQFVAVDQLVAAFGGEPRVRGDTVSADLSGLLVNGFAFGVGGGRFRDGGIAVHYVVALRVDAAHPRG
ncbi:hypothetical protein [Streptomyces sp. NPDC058240]|uniref:hypothetical protein n=1 Tax=Streptomyces sp. NPDC058240 TaxID=3346396 RepID=UPI0036EB936F